MEIKDTDIKRKRALGFGIGAIMFAVSSLIVQKVFFSPPSFDDALVKSANEINKHCPFMIDKETRLDNTAALPGKTMLYNYTLVNIDKSKVDSNKLKESLEHMKQRIYNTLNTSPDFSTYRENSGIMEYCYKDKNGVFLYQFSDSLGKKGQ